VLMLDRDGSLLCTDSRKPKPAPMKRAFAEIQHKPEEDQSGRIVRLLALAFDQLGFRRLELRVSDQDQH
jgi:hypothetical protein